MSYNASPEFVKLGRAIAAARQAMGMAKQSDLAAALNVSQQTVSRWEAGAARPGREPPGGGAVSAGNASGRGSERGRR